MTEPDPLQNLPRLGAEALGPCVECGKLILATGMPVFYRIEVRYCGVDAAAVNQHVGLALQLGGGLPGLAIASVMGAHRGPVVQVAQATANLCQPCAQADWQIMGLLARVLEAE